MSVWRALIVRDDGGGTTTNPRPADSVWWLVLGGVCLPVLLRLPKAVNPSPPQRSWRVERCGPVRGYGIGAGYDWGHVQVR